MIIVYSLKINISPLSYLVVLRVLNSLRVANLTNLFPFSLSDLRKEFEVPPYSQSVELGSQIELRCHPPQGKPKPRVSKD